MNNVNDELAKALNEFIDGFKKDISNGVINYDPMHEIVFIYVEDREAMLGVFEYQKTFNDTHDIKFTLAHEDFDSGYMQVIPRIFLDREY